MRWGREKERDTVLDNIRLWCQLEHRSQRNYFAIRFAKFFNNIMWTCACKQVRNAQAYKWDLRLRGSIQCTVYLSFIISKIYRLLCTVNIIYLLHFSVLPPPPVTYTVQNQCVSTRLKRCALCLYIDKWFYFPWALFADCVCVLFVMVSCVLASLFPILAQIDGYLFIWQWCDSQSNLNYWFNQWLARFSASTAAVLFFFSSIFCKRKQKVDQRHYRITNAILFFVYHVCVWVCALYSV